MLRRLLPPIPRPPHDPTSLRLDGRAGWQMMAADTKAAGKPGVRVLPFGGALTLLGKSQRTMTEASGTFGGLILPRHVALAADGSIFLLDSRGPTFKRFDPCCCRFEKVPCIAGQGTGPHQVLSPHGIAICGSNLFICDSGNHRVSVFTLRGFALRGHWQPPSTVQLANAWEPYAAVCDVQGRLYVADRANGAVHRFSAAGQWEKHWIGFGLAGQLAFDCDGRLFVLDESAPPQLWQLGMDGAPLRVDALYDEMVGSFAPMPFAVDANGNLDLMPLCVVPPGCEAPSGVFDAFGDLITAPQATRPTFEKEGFYYSRSLDSEFYQCQWHRIVLCGLVPPGSSLEIATFTAETEWSDSQIMALDDERWQTNLTIHRLLEGEWDGLIRSGGGRYLWLRVILRGNGFATPCVGSLEIEFPRISLRRYLPAVFSAEAVSADFTDRFLSLFDTTLRGIERTIDQQARFFDPLAAPAQRVNGRMDFLTWLGSWIGVAMDRQWPEEKRRRLLQRAGQLYDLRGTRHGLWQQLVLLLDMEAERICCDHDGAASYCTPRPCNCEVEEEAPCAWQPPPLILEHYRLRRWLWLGASTLGDQAVLWGKRIVNRSQLDANAQVGGAQVGGAQVGGTQLKSTQDPLRDPFHVYAHQFSVFVPARWGRDAGYRKGLEKLIKNESPGHTEGQLVLVEPRFRIGVQSMIGLDAVVGRLPAGVTLDQTTLGGASILSGPLHAQGDALSSVGGESRVGSTMQLR